MAIVCVTCFGTGTALGAVVKVTTIIAVPTGNLVAATLARGGTGALYQVQVPEMTAATADAWTNGPPCPICNGSGILLG